MSGKKKIQVISFQSLSANSGAGMARLGYYLSEELTRRGIFKNFIVHSKGKFDTPFTSKPVSVFSRYYLYILNTLNRFVKIPTPKFRLLQERIYDWFCCFRIERDTTVILSTNSFLKHTFKKAKAMGILVVLLPGTPEENYIYEIVTEENRKLHKSTIDAYTYKTRIAYFNDSIKHVDKVIGALPTVYTSYVESTKFKGEVVKILGHMTPDFKPSNDVAQPATDGSYRVGYIAHTVVLKGLHYLIEAWQKIMTDPTKGHMKLYIGGNIEAPIEEYIFEHFAPFKNIEFVGHVSDASVFMKELDLFVVPSLIDGAPITALEAAYKAVPVIITDNCGSAELLSRGDSGCWTIPIRDADAIRERILWAESHRAEARTVGANAKRNLDTYNMNDYVQQVADYLEYKV